MALENASKVVWFGFVRVLDFSFYAAYRPSWGLFWTRLVSRVVWRLVGVIRKCYGWGALKLEGSEMWSFPFEEGGDDTNSSSALIHNRRVTFFIPYYMEFTPFNALFSYILFHRFIFNGNPRRHPKLSFTWRDIPFELTYHWNGSRDVRVKHDTCLKYLRKILYNAFLFPKAYYTHKHIWRSTQDFLKVGIGVGFSWLKDRALNTQEHTFKDQYYYCDAVFNYCDATRTCNNESGSSDSKLRRTPSTYCAAVLLSSAKFILQPFSF